ncbi:MAG TPA: flagellar basal body-associated FliL family protein [Bacillota bacterium]|nr:flagellar basal body-associated FliL family protein [Bacillota bacterium]HOL10019.1 flagellar basal body-associated FliL family protein [Bacillota bacterium]HPO97769.1 flagellar basal body-associated FliL family protein [Bacillota bacterium]
MAKDNVTNNEAKAKNSTVTVVLIGLFSFLITVVIAGTVIFLTLRNDGSSHPNVELGVGTKKNVELGPLVSIGNDIIVNLAKQGSMDYYLKVNVTLEAGNKKVAEELTNRIPQVRDLLINILSSKTIDKINEKEGKELIRREIINDINEILSTGKIKNVFFQEFVIQ